MQSTLGALRLTEVGDKIIAGHRGRQLMESSSLMLLKL